MTSHARILDIVFESAHYNRNCGCTIPEGWVAWVEVAGVRLPKMIGGSPRDLVARLKAEYGRVTAPSHVHAVVDAN